MTKGWQTKRLDEVCLFTNGLWKGEKLPLRTVGVIRNTNFMKDGTLDDTDIAYIEVEVKKFEKRRLRFGDIILEKSGGGPKQPVGRVALFEKEDGDFSFSNFTAALRVKDADELDFRYLHKYLFWLYQSGVTEGMQSHSTGIRNLDGDAYKAIEISFPLLAEQQRIVGILDKTFEGIATAKANVEKNFRNALDLFESYLQSIFANPDEEWEQKLVKDVGQTQTGTTPKTAETENYGHFIPFIKPADVDFTGLGDLRYDNEGLSEIGLRRGRKIPSGSVLMVCIGATIGKVGFANREVSCNQQINVLTPKMEYVPRFFYYAMISSEFRSKVLLAGKGAQATLPIINKTKWENLTFSFPSLKADQQKIVDKLDLLRVEIKRLEVMYQQKLCDLDELKKSALYKAFNGELVGACS